MMKSNADLVDVSTSPQIMIKAVVYLVGCVTGEWQLWNAVQLQTDSVEVASPGKVSTMDRFHKFGRYLN